MKNLIDKYRFTVKPVSLENSSSVELARSIEVHPLTYHGQAGGAAWVVVTYVVSYQ